MKKLLRIPVAFVFLLLVLGTVIFANFLQMLSLVIAPFSERLFRATNRFLCDTWYRFLRWSLAVPIGVKFIHSGDELPWRENGFLISNHQAMADIPALLTVARFAGRMGDLKWFVKDPLKWVPGIGWGMQFLDCLFVKRNWTADKEGVTATFAKLKEKKIPFWIVSFLEGTRSSPSKIARSQAFAVKQGWKPMKHVMLPRTKGFEATLEGLGSTLQAIYIATIAYEGPAPHLLQLFFGPTERVHIHVRRYSSWPNDKEERNRWILARYEEKDALLAHFREHGRFP